MNAPALYTVTHNEGEHGAGRMPWLLTAADGRLVAHSGIRGGLQAWAESLNAAALVAERALFALPNHSEAA